MASVLFPLFWHSIITCASGARIPIRCKFKSRGIGTRKRLISPFGWKMPQSSHFQEGILFADLDLGAITRSKFDFDVAGHYARPDVFQLRINEKPHRSVISDGKK